MPQRAKGKMKVLFQGLSHTAFALPVWEGVEVHLDRECLLTSEIGGRKSPDWGNEHMENREAIYLLTLEV